MKLFIYSITALLFISISGCSTDDNNCPGTIYKAPSLYTGVGGTIYVSYYAKDKSVESNGSCVDNTDNFTLVFAKSVDDGATWVKKALISVLLPSNATEVMSQSMAVNSAGYIFIAYITADKQLKCAVSKDEGNSFTHQNIEIDLAVNGYSVINDVVSGNVYIAYNTYNINDASDTANVILKFAKYNAGAGTWTTNQIVDSTAITGFAPSIMTTGNSKVFISYYYRGTSGNAGLKYAISSNAGTSWTLGNIKAGDSKVSGPLSWAISDTNNYIYVSFYDPDGYSSGGSNGWIEKDTGTMKMAKSTDFGATWSTVTIDSNANTGKSSTTVPGMGGTYIDVCYGLLINYTSLYSTDNQILCSQSTNGGVSFSTPVQVDTGGYVDSNVAGLNYINMAMDFYGSYLYLVYTVANEDGTTTLKLARSSDGNTWTKNVIY